MVRMSVNDAGQHFGELIDRVSKEGITVEIQRDDDRVVAILTPVAGNAHTESFVLRAQRLDTHGSTGTALDLVYDSIDQLMRESEFERLDSILANLAVSDLSIDVLLGVLTATLPARNRLPARRRLFTEIESVLTQRGEYEEGLLTGLEG